ncbi:hypothetical protein [Aestuariivivens sediminicola]|uniref:hypothetical protein n=1 Tax=Aestuariivivens sediminicola TaxID=2913560 RepID=UPI001F56AC89|nr:hypothetical protein [Aestuariivivens sediminicola]
MKLLKLIILLSLFLSSCVRSKSNSSNNSEIAIHKAVVKEVLQVSGYTYLRVDEDDVEKWIAAPLSKVQVDQTYYYQDPMEMKNFESKELGRRFESIYFVNAISATEDMNSVVSDDSKPSFSGSKRDPQNLGTKPEIQKKDVNVISDNSTISIAQLYEKKEEFNNTRVRIKGEVTKYNPAIMNVNWLHLQDGTDYKGNFDLTATTQDEVAVGDVITIEGKVVLDKDFGSGYFYKIILEEGKIIK